MPYNMNVSKNADKLVKFIRQHKLEHKAIPKTLLEKEFTKEEIQTLKIDIVIWFEDGMYYLY